MHAIMRGLVAVTMILGLLHHADGLFVCAAVHGPADPRPAARVMTTNCAADVAAVNAVVGNGSYFNCHNELFGSGMYNVQLTPNTRPIRVSFLMTSMCPQTDEFGGAEDHDDVHLTELDRAVGNNADFRCGHHRQPGGAAGHESGWYSIVAVQCPRVGNGFNSVNLLNQLDGVDPHDPRLGPAPPTTSRPTIAPTTNAPTTSLPTPRPILDIVTDCGQFHTDCTGRLLQNYDSSSNQISCEGSRCVCTGLYHCHNTLSPGRCASPMDHCLERDITESPSIAPSSTIPSMDPTRVPTPDPTFYPSFSNPSSFPTDAPFSSIPTAMISSTVARGKGTDSQYFFDNDEETFSPTSSAPSPIRTSETQSDDAASNDDSTIIVVVGVACLVVVLAAAIGVYVVKTRMSGSRQQEVKGFDNPMYDTNTADSVSSGTAVGGYMDVSGDFDPSGTSSGYMDIPVNQGDATSSGYMDVPADIHNDDDEEEDV